MFNSLIDLCHAVGIDEERPMFYTTQFIRGKRPPFRGIFKYKDEEGRWRQISRILEAQTLPEARRELAEKWLELEAEHERALEETALDGTSTVSEYAEGYVKMLGDSMVLEKSTLSIYGYLLKHVRDGVGDIRLCDLRTDQLQSWEASLLADGLSPSSVRKVHALLKSALNNAVNTGILQRNPMMAVRPPKAVSPLPNSLTDRQRKLILTFLDSTSSTPFGLGVLIALSTGMRVGEICGLTWADVSFDTRTIWVRKAIARHDGKFYVKQPKTRGSLRDVPIASSLLEPLDKRRKAQATELIVAGLSPTTDRMSRLYVLGGIDGSFLPPTKLSKDWKALAESLGLVGTQGRRPTFHDLRHTFATYAISEGIDVKTVSSILGHANAAMTLNIYASADPNSKRAAAETIDRVVGKRLEPRELAAIVEEGRGIA